MTMVFSGDGDGGGGRGIVCGRLLQSTLAMSF